MVLFWSKKSKENNLITKVIKHQTLETGKETLGD